MYLKDCTTHLSNFELYLIIIMHLYNCIIVTFLKNKFNILDIYELNLKQFGVGKEKLFVKYKIVFKIINVEIFFQCLFLLDFFLNKP